MLTTLALVPLSGYIQRFLNKDIVLRQLKALWAWFRLLASAAFWIPLLGACLVGPFIQCWVACVWWVATLSINPLILDTSPVGVVSIMIRKYMVKNCSKTYQMILFYKRHKGALVDEGKWHHIPDIVVPPNIKLWETHLEIVWYMTHLYLLFLCWECRTVDLLTFTADTSLCILTVTEHRPTRCAVHGLKAQRKYIHT